MLKKGMILYSIFKNKCPRCHKGDFYVDGNPYHFKELFEMHKTCSNCSLKYEMEPSFFQGAMYVSYGLTVAVFVTIFVICYLLGIDLVYTTIIILTAIIVLMPVTFKLSRIIYMNFFYSYDKKYINKND